MDLSTPIKATTSEPHGLIRKRPCQTAEDVLYNSSGLLTKPLGEASHRLEVEGSFGTEGSDLPSSIGC